MYEIGQYIRIEYECTMYIVEINLRNKTDCVYDDMTIKRMNTVCRTHLVGKENDDDKHFITA
jgi:hypothetical protein